MYICISLSLSIYIYIYCCRCDIYSKERERNGIAQGDRDACRTVITQEEART